MALVWVECPPGPGGRLPSSQIERGTLWTLLVTFCIVIIRCTDAFWSPCICNYFGTRVLKTALGEGYNTQLILTNLCDNSVCSQRRKKIKQDLLQQWSNSCRSRCPCGQRVCLNILDCWDRRFESRWGPGHWSALLVAVYVAASGTSRLLVQRSPTGCVCVRSTDLNNKASWAQVGL
jgi:hypothetical protein